MMKMIIENESLLLRELVETDVNVIFELYSDKEAMKYRGNKPFEFNEIEVFKVNYKTSETSFDMHTILTAKKKK